MILLELIAKFTLWLEEKLQPPEVKETQLREKKRLQKLREEAQKRREKFLRENGFKP
tara:strand:+ start:136 stop:306 length:171 start_codon:yes stop_codon:yes gene_type:complete